MPRFSNADQSNVATIFSWSFRDAPKAATQQHAVFPIKVEVEFGGGGGGRGEVEFAIISSIFFCILEKKIRDIF